ncbi:STAS-like domain-containing protein [Vibrio splendidus]|uniref:STAS-like domain-containing protein n=1 Tax=Vibrio splendidus TaxID=29497 RepID=UPI0015E63751|nr:STAS-like domain-containing protein [Vibrio splendidus]
MKIEVLVIVGKTAVSREGGLKLKAALDASLGDNAPIQIDFTGVEIYASPFFNTAIAPFLGQMSIDSLKEKVSFTNLSPVGKRLLNQVIHNAIQFYSKAELEQSDLEDKIHKGLE